MHSWLDTIDHPGLHTTGFPMPRFAAACFDLDGTLIDTTPLHLTAESETLQEMGIDPRDPRRPWTFGLGDEGAMQMLADSFGLDQGKLLEAYVPRWYAQVSAGPKLLPGVLDALSRIKRTDVPIALVTTGDRSYVQAVFEARVLEQFFDAVITLDDVTHLKPHPEPYLKAAQLLGVRPTDCVGFEDSPAGLSSLRSAGMFAVSVVGDSLSTDADLSLGGVGELDEKMVQAFFS